jgi:hypothetical protein
VPRHFLADEHIAGPQFATTLCVNLEGSSDGCSGTRADEIAQTVSETFGLKVGELRRVLVVVEKTVGFQGTGEIFQVCATRFFRA